MFCKKRKYPKCGSGKIIKIVSMKFFCLMFVSSLYFSCSTSHNAYTEKAQHKKIAVLPAIVNFYLRAKDSAKVSQQLLDEGSLKIGFVMQTELYSRILKKDYSVSIEPIKITNEKLFSKGLTFNQYKTLPDTTIARMLDVDAIVVTNTIIGRGKIKDEEVIFNSASSFILGNALSGVLALGSFNSKIDEVNMDVKIVETKSGNNIWNIQYINNKHYVLGEFIERSSYNIAKKLPYKK